MPLVRFLGWLTATLLASGVVILAFDSPMVGTGIAVGIGILGGVQALRAYMELFGQAEEPLVVRQLWMAPLRAGGLMMATLGVGMMMSGGRYAGRVGLPLLVVGLVTVVAPTAVWKAWRNPPAPREGRRP